MEVYDAQLPSSRRFRPGAHRRRYQILHGGRTGNWAEADRPLVILVDDDASLREALQELMQSVGLDTISFASTRELLKAELPDRPAASSPMYGCRA